MNLQLAPSNLRTFICGHLFRNERAIGYVFHDTEGDISMTCGPEDCDVNDVDNIKIVGLGHMLEREPKFKKLDWLPIEFEAFNDPDGDWVLTPFPKEEENP